MRKSDIGPSQAVRVVGRGAKAKKSMLEQCFSDLGADALKLSNLVRALRNRSGDGRQQLQA